MRRKFFSRCFAVVSSPIRGFKGGAKVGRRWPKRTVANTNSPLRPKPETITGVRGNATVGNGGGPYPFRNSRLQVRQRAAGTMDLSFLNGVAWYKSAAKRRENLDWPAKVKEQGAACSARRPSGRPLKKPQMCAKVAVRMPRDPAARAHEPGSGRGGTTFGRYADAFSLQSIQVRLFQARTRLRRWKRTLEMCIEPHQGERRAFNEIHPPTGRGWAEFWTRRYDGINARPARNTQSGLNAVLVPQKPPTGFSDQVKKPPLHVEDLKTTNDFYWPKSKRSKRPIHTERLPYRSACYP